MEQKDKTVNNIQRIGLFRSLCFCYYFTVETSGKKFMFSSFFFKCNLNERKKNINKSESFQFLPPKCLFITTQNELEEKKTSVFKMKQKI